MSELAKPTRQQLEDSKFIESFRTRLKNYLADNGKESENIKMNALTYVRIYRALQVENLYIALLFRETIKQGILYLDNTMDKNRIIIK